MNNQIDTPPLDTTSLGYKIFTLRENKEIGQKELAKLLHVSVSTISNYEHNVHQPALRTIIKIADYFNVSVDYLLNRTNYQYPMSYLEQPLIDNYSCSDILNTVIQLSKPSRSTLMEQLDLLSLRDRNTRLSASNSSKNKPKKN
mgnify:CR=1 FL=1